MTAAMKLKRCLFLGRKAMTNLDNILENRNITLQKVHLVKAMVFPVVMYGCESWTIKKAEHRRIDAFELWYWKDWCWSWNSNTLATWCEELTHWKRFWCLKDWGQEEKGMTEEEKGMTEDEMVEWHHWLNGHGFGWTLGVGDGQGGLVCCGSWGHKESDMTERLNWTETAY